MPDRFDFLPSQATLETAHGVSQLRAEVQALRTVVGALLIGSLQGRLPDLTQDPFRSFFNVPDGADPAAALAHAVRIAAPALGKVTCPECGAVVKDLAGVTDERCVFCGHVLTTQS